MIDLQIIKTLCIQQGITLKKLSDDTGISQTALTMAIHRNSTTLETLEKIANYFGVSAGWFFGEEDGFKPVRKLFTTFNEELTTTTSIMAATMQYWVRDLQLPCDLDVFFNEIGKQASASDDIVKMLEHCYKKLFDHPACIFLKEMTRDEIIKMQQNGIITQNVADFIISIKEPEPQSVNVTKQHQLSFWEKLKLNFKIFFEH